MLFRSVSEHLRGIVHGDLKCVSSIDSTLTYRVYTVYTFCQINILLQHSTSTPVITDFGVSHEVRNGTFTRELITTGRVPIGTLPWMARELVQHEEGKIMTYTKEADVWSFSMTIYV